jgi:hypothetical protein
MGGVLHLNDITCARCCVGRWAALHKRRTERCGCAVCDHMARCLAIPCGLVGARAVTQKHSSVLHGTAHTGRCRMQLQASACADAGVCMPQQCSAVRGARLLSCPHMNVPSGPFWAAAAAKPP